MTYATKLQQLLDIVRHADPAWADAVEHMTVDDPSFRFMLPDPDTAVIEYPLTAGFCLTIKLVDRPDGSRGYSMWESYELRSSSPSDWTLVRGREPSPRFVVIGTGPQGPPRGPLMLY